MCESVRPWEQSWNGRTWEEMPGSGPDNKKMNFYLWRRGKITLSEEAEVLCEDGTIRPQRLRRVDHEKFGKMGMTAMMERKRARTAPGEVVVPRTAERLMVLRRRLDVLRGHMGFMVRVAEEAGLSQAGLCKIARGVRGCRERVLERIEAAVAVVARRAESGRLARRAPKYLTAPAPPGCVLFKDWLAGEAARLGLKVHTLRTRMMRGTRPWPELVKLNQRRWYVREKAAERAADDRVAGCQGDGVMKGGGA